MKNKNQDLIEKTLAILEDYASRKKLINYGYLYEELGLDRKNPDHRNTGAYILAEVNRITLNENKVMLSAIVTLSSEQAPAKGFFDFAVDLKQIQKGLSEENKTIFWAEQIKKIFNVYKNKEFYKAEDLADKLDVNIMTIYRYIKAKRLKAYKIGKEYRIDKKEFKKFLESVQNKK